MNKLYLSSLLLSMVSLPTTTAYPKGAPASICGSMLPGHGKEPQPVAGSPYHVQVPRFALKQNDRIKITLTSESETPFKGFLMKALDVPGNNIIGTFNLLETGVNTTAQYLACTHPQSAICHTSNDEKITQIVEWSPPAQFSGPVVMVATFVKDGYTYWVNVTSDTLMVGTGEGGKGTGSYVAMSGYAWLLICVLVLVQ